jgi:hypothetical protein
MADRSRLPKNPALHAAAVTVEDMVEIGTLNEGDEVRLHGPVLWEKGFGKVVAISKKLASSIYSLDGMLTVEYPNGERVEVEYKAFGGEHAYARVHSKAVTVRSYLDTFMGGSDHVQDGGALDTVIDGVTLVAHTNPEYRGKLFVSCGGEAIVEFATQYINRRPAYLVNDRGTLKVVQSG